MFIQKFVIELATEEPLTEEESSTFAENLHQFSVEGSSESGEDVLAHVYFDEACEIDKRKATNWKKKAGYLVGD